MTAEPKRFVVVAGKNRIALTAKVSGRPALFGRVYTGTLKLSTDNRHVSVEPGTIQWRVEVPAVWPYLAAVSACATLLVAIVLWLRWPRVVTGGLRIEDDGYGKIVVGEVAHEVGDTIDLRAFETRRVTIGLSEGCSIVLAGPDGEPRSEDTGWIVCVGRRRGCYLKRSAEAGETVAVEPGMEGAEQVDLGPGNHVLLQHEDRIRTEGMTLVFEDV